MLPDPARTGSSWKRALAALRGAGHNALMSRGDSHAQVPRRRFRGAAEGGDREDLSAPLVPGAIVPIAPAWTSSRSRLPAVRREDLSAPLFPVPAATSTPAASELDARAAVGRAESEALLGQCELTAEVSRSRAEVEMEADIQADAELEVAFHLVEEPELAEHSEVEPATEVPREISVHAAANTTLDRPRRRRGRRRLARRALAAGAGVGGMWSLLALGSLSFTPAEIVLDVPTGPTGKIHCAGKRLALRGSAPGAERVHVLDAAGRELTSFAVVGDRFAGELELEAGRRRQLVLGGVDLAPLELLVVQDDADPRLGWLQEPPRYSSSREVELRLSVHDENLAQVTVDGVVVPAATPEWFHELTVQLPENGERTLEVVAEDHAGRRSTISTTLAHDSLAPRLVGGAPSGSDVLELDEQLVVDWHFDEQLRRAELDGQLLELDAAPDGGTLARGRFAASSHAGPRVLRWSAEDLAGNRRTGEVELEVLPPVELTLEWPGGVGFDSAGVAYLREPGFTLEGRLAGGRSSLLRLEERESGRLLGQARLAPDQQDFRLEVEAGGSRRLEARLVTEGLEQPVDLAFDGEAPRLSWSAAPELRTEGLWLSWSVEEENLAGVELDGRPVVAGPDGRYTGLLSLPLDGATSPDGEVSVVAFDRSGNRSTLVHIVAVAGADSTAGERARDTLITGGGAAGDAAAGPKSGAAEAAPLASPSTDAVPVPAAASGVLPASAGAPRVDEFSVRLAPLGPGDDPWGSTGPELRESFLRLDSSLVVDVTRLDAEGAPARFPLRILQRRTGLVLRYVPGGEFGLGRLDGPDDEAPERRVRLRGFYMAETEVSLDAWLRGGGEEPDLPGWHGGREHPVVEIDWDQAATWCADSGLELPSEAQWEWAAVGPAERTWPWGELWHGGELTNSGGGGDGWVHTAPAGSLPGDRSWCGILDLAGNVSEWCADLYSPDYSWVEEGQLEPLSLEGRSGAYVERGGAFDDEDPTSSTFRFGYSPTGTASLGFRPVLRP